MDDKVDPASRCCAADRADAWCWLQQGWNSNEYLTESCSIGGSSSADSGSSAAVWLFQFLLKYFDSQDRWREATKNLVTQKISNLEKS